MLLGESYKKTAHLAKKKTAQKKRKNFVGEGVARSPGRTFIDPLAAVRAVAAGGIIPGEDLRMERKDSE
jgi:hypothetical protein